MTSILNSVKKLLGLTSEDHSFDVDILIHINTVFSILTQLGVGPEEGYSITGDTEEWSDYLEDNKLLEMVKSYMFLKVRLMFDPPQNSALIESINKYIAELEWRINVSVDPKKEET